MILTLPAVNIQYPISRLILDGRKSIETRTYKLPNQYTGQPLFLIETPGKSGDFTARAVGIITFGESFRYQSKSEFNRDISRHQVDRNSPWAWKQSEKWGWPILEIRVFHSPVEVSTRRGIVWTRKMRLVFKLRSASTSFRADDTSPLQPLL